MSTKRLAVAGLAVLALCAGCGSDAKDKVDAGRTSVEKVKDQATKAKSTLEQQGQQLKQQAEALQRESKDLQQKVKDGKMSAQDAADQLQRDGRALADKSASAADAALDRLKSEGLLTDQQKQQIEDARKELSKATGG